MEFLLLFVILLVIGVVTGAMSAKSDLAGDDPLGIRTYDDWWHDEHGKYKPPTYLAFVLIVLASLAVVNRGFLLFYNELLFPYLYENIFVWLPLMIFAAAIFHQDVKIKLRNRIRTQVGDANDPLGIR